MIALSYPQTITHTVLEYFEPIKEFKKAIAIHDAIYFLFERTIVEDDVTSVVFVDVDGVLFDQRGLEESVQSELRQIYPKPPKPLSSLYDQFAAKKFNLVAMANLHYVLTSVSGCAFVLSSSWGTKRSQYLLRTKIFSFWLFFAQATISKTDNLKKEEVSPEWQTIYKKFGRGLEISRWLKQHPTIKHYAIVDDCDYGLSLHGARFVHVNARDLFTRQDADRVIELLKS